MNDRTKVLASMLLAACGPEAIEAAELGEICGEPAPIRILETDPSDRMASASEWRQVDGRRVVGVGYFGEEDPSGPFPGGHRHELWSFGLCGEAPRLLAQDLWSRTEERWPDVLLGCRVETGEVLTLDPNGEREPHVVFTLPDCHGTSTPHGIVFVDPLDEDTATLRLFPYVGDPWTETATSRVVFDPIRIRADPPHVFPTVHAVLSVHDDEVLAVTTDDELVAISLVTESVQTHADNVREFKSSPDGRWIVWQDLQRTSDDEEWPPGAVYLLDRATGNTTHLADTALGATHEVFRFIDAGVIRLRLGYLYRDPERFWFLPELSSIDMPAHLDVKHRLDDGRWLVGDHFGGPYHLYNPALAESRTLFDGDGDIRLVDGGLEIIERVNCCINQEFGRPEGKLWFVPWDGERQLLARRATAGYRFFGDGRLLTNLDVDEQRRGSLVVVDPETLEARLVDESVVAGYRSIDEDDVALYGVVDGERSGVWLTKLAPAESSRARGRTRFDETVLGGPGLGAPRQPLLSSPSQR